jgi:hypothetical protein
MLTNDQSGTLQRQAELCEQLGLQIPDLFLPAPDTDLFHWAVVACDQFTAQPEYNKFTWNIRAMIR